MWKGRVLVGRCWGTGSTRHGGGCFWEDFSAEVTGALLYSV